MAKATNEQPHVNDDLEEEPKPEQEHEEDQTFEELGLDPRLIRALTKNGIDKPTPIQRVAIPLILEGKDVVARAKTGSGKTLAYVLPLLHKLFSDSGSKKKLAPAAFVLVPTRELCQQYQMESKEPLSIMELDRKIYQIFSDFMSRVTQFEELVAVGSRLLVGFHQGLEFLRRPSVNKTSDLVERIIKANETERVSKYVEAGCVNAHDSVQNISRLHTCQVGLQDHLSKGKCIVNELEALVTEVTGVMQAANESTPHLDDEVTGDLVGPEATTYEKEPKITEYAVMMGIIYSMVKKDYIMQERIISSLDLKSPSGELESYNLMWSLRPFIDNEIMHQAWRLIP